MTAALVGDGATKSGYGRRSLAENTTYRYKALIGSVMRSHTLRGQSG